MKKIINITILTLFINSVASAELSVNFANQSVGIQSGSAFVSQGSLMQLIWAATGSTLSSVNAYNIGLDQALDGEVILNQQLTSNGFGFYGPSTGVYTDSDVGGVDINSGFFYLRAFDSASGVVGQYVRDFNQVDASQWVYNPVNTATIYQGNLTGGNPGGTVDIQASGFQIIDEPVTGPLTITNLSSLTLSGSLSSALFIDDADIINLTNIEALGSDGLSVTSSVGAAAGGYDGLELLGSREIYITNTTESISGGDGATAKITDTGFEIAEASGGNGIALDFVSESRVFTTEGIRLSGGSGGLATGRVGNTLNANGGNALHSDSGHITLNGIFSGGSGGLVSLDAIDLGNSLATSMNANGAHAVDLNASTIILEPIRAGSQFIGGNGGQKVNDGQTILTTNISANVNGGNGLNLRWNGSFDNSKSVIISDGSFSGGDAGNASADQVAASGGSGLFVSGGHNLVISNGIFTGGSGGEISALTEGVADGGSGAYIFGAGNDIVSAEIIAGTFAGGAGGSVNGVSAADGYGLKIEASDVQLYSGVSVIGDLFVNAGPYVSSTVVYGGSYSDVYFTSITNESYQNLGVNRGDFEIQGGTFETISINGFEGHDGVITGGSVESVIVTGSGDQNLRFGGSATVGDIIFNNQGMNNLWLSNNVSLETSGNLTVSDGEVDLNEWSSAYIKNVTLNNAVVLRLNDQNSTMSHGNLFRLDDNSRLEFNNNLITFDDSSTLDVGLGAVTGTDIVMASNSVTKIGVSANGASSTPTKGTLTASSSINFEEGAIVQLVNDGTYTKWDELEGTDGIIIANASSITALNTNQVSIVGDKPWLTGVIGLNIDSNNLYAEIGLLDLGRALNATGELATMADKLQPLIDGSAEIAGLFRDGFPTQQAAISGITDSFFRAPEVANSLIGLQSVVRDQVAGRTRGYLKANRFGASAPRGPRGPDAGWWDRSMERINESLPKADLWGGLDRQEDQQQSYYKRFMNWLNEKSPSFKPSAPTLTSDYKSWGKAYYSDLAQDAADGFAGYEAQVIGGIAGMDRKLDHGVLGWAAGYADTTILGNFDQNADVDTLHGTIYYTAATQRAYLDASMSYAYSLVETIGPAGAGGYAADYTASNLSFALGAGVGFTAFNDRVQVTPEFLFLSTLYDQEAYTEASAVTGMPDKQFSAYDDWSHKVELGATFSLLKILESTSMNIAIQPELRLHWLHEFNPNLEDQSYLFAGDQFSAALQVREENLLRTGLGIRFWDWTDHRTEFSFDLDAITGSDYEEFTVGGSFIHRF